MQRNPTLVSGSFEVSVSNLIGAGTSHPSWKNTGFNRTTDNSHRRQPI